MTVIHCGSTGYKENTWILRQFMRALFGLAPSPFLLGNVIKHHLNSWETCKPDAVAELHESLYVDDLTSGGATVEEAKDLKKHATFTLHKWHSNTCELDESPVLPVGKGVLRWPSG